MPFAFSHQLIVLRWFLRQPIAPGRSRSLERALLVGLTSCSRAVRCWGTQMASSSCDVPDNASRRVRRPSPGLQRNKWAPGGRGGIAVSVSRPVCITYGLREWVPRRRLGWLCNIGARSTILTAWPFSGRRLNGLLWHAADATYFESAI